MSSTIDGKLTPVSDRFFVPIVQSQYGLDIGDITQEQYNGLAKQLSGRNGPLILGVFYDLIQDPEKYKPDGDNLNTGRCDLRVKVVVTQDGFVLKRDGRQNKMFSRYLEGRGQDAERLEGRRKEYVPVIIYERS